MMDSSPANNRIPALIFSACGAWETTTGRKLADAAAVVDFLRALKTDEKIWQRILATTEDFPEMRNAARQLRTTLAAVEFTSEVSLPDILAKLGVDTEIQQFFLTTMNNAARRNALIKAAFAADSPAATAVILTTVTDQDNNATHWRSIAGDPPANRNTVNYPAVVGLAIIAAIAIFIMLGPHLKNMIFSSFAYKGVTPDTPC